MDSDLKVQADAMQPKPDLQNNKFAEKNLLMTPESINVSPLKENFEVDQGAVLIFELAAKSRREFEKQDKEMPALSGNLPPLHSVLTLLSFSQQTNTKEGKAPNQKKSSSSSPKRKMQADVSQEEKKKKFKCLHENCAKGFPSRAHLARHMRIHTGEKPYKCLLESCGKYFSRQDNMLQHYRSHVKSVFHPPSPPSI